MTLSIFKYLSISRTSLPTTLNIAELHVKGTSGKHILGYKPFAILISSNGILWNNGFNVDAINGTKAVL
jgi:hypothetical protein